MKISGKINRTLVSKIQGFERDKPLRNGKESKKTDSPKYLT